MVVPIIILAIIAIVVGVVGGYYYRKSVHERKLDAAKYTAEGVLAEAKKQAETATKEALLEAKEDRVSVRVHHTTQKDTQFKTRELLISEIFHLAFSHQG